MQYRFQDQTNFEINYNSVISDINQTRTTMKTDHVDYLNSQEYPSSSLNKVNDEEKDISFFNRMRKRKKKEIPKGIDFKTSSYLEYFCGITNWTFNSRINQSLFHMVIIIVFLVICLPSTRAADVIRIGMLFHSIISYKK